MTRSVFNHRRGTIAGLLLSDTFNRADNSSVVGSSNGSGLDDPHAWTQSKGTWGITSNTLYCSSPLSSPTVSFCSQDIGVADVDIQVTVAANHTTSSYASIIIFRDSTNWGTNGFNGSQQFYWGWGLTSTGVVLNKYNPFSSVSTVYSNSESNASGDVLRVVASGNSISVYKNGTLKATTTDSFNATATRHGLYSGPSSAPQTTWDDFTVYSPGYR